MKKKYIIIIIFFFVIIYRIYNINIVNKYTYLDLLDKKVNNYIYGKSAPRGRILDRNGKILVDNIGVKSLIYRKPKGIKIKDELEIAKKLSDIIDIEINENTLKNYYLLINNNGNDLIKKEEYDLYNKRKISDKELLKLKLDRITDEMLNDFSEKDKKIATIYNLMNKGYSFDNKIIKNGITDEEYGLIIDKNISGISTILNWERVYNYGDTLKDIFGFIGSIPVEEKNEYLKNGYSLDDIVGISYLEKEYESYLKGEKELYKVNSDNSLTLIKEGKNGKDLVLSIDIDVELELERIIKKTILDHKKRKNTNYFNEMYAIVGEPKTGAIIAMSGQKLVDSKEKIFKSVNTNLINNSYTVGSVVKMGTMSVGYKYNVVDIGTTYTDGCIKLYNVPIKCSYKSLGKVSDLTAISKSSNYYQYKIAIDIIGEKYKYNMKLDASKDDFDKFRNVYKEYGLGSITGIDLPNEKIGIIGNSYKSDLLLNLSIGQYDTYTPIELFQYVNTVADLGKKRRPQLMMEIDGIKNEYNVISEVNLDIKYKERLVNAMHKVISSGTGVSYINKKYNGAGKTGTSETFVDSNNDGVMDTKTLSFQFVGFAPYNDPKYSVVVLAPDLYVSKSYSYPQVYITRFVSKDIMNFLFEK